MLPNKIFFPSDNTTAILKEVKNKVGIYEYEDGYFFKGTIIEFTEIEINKMIKKRKIKA